MAGALLFIPYNWQQNILTNEKFTECMVQCFGGLRINYLPNRIQETMLSNKVWTQTNNNSYVPKGIMMEPNLSYS